MDTEYYRFTLRIPVVLRDWLEARAKARHKTLTGELVEIIREMKEKEEQKPSEGGA